MDKNKKLGILIWIAIVAFVFSLIGGFMYVMFGSMYSIFGFNIVGIIATFFSITIFSALVGFFIQDIPEEKQNESDVKEKKKPTFRIEYYPITKKYRCKYKDMYLDKKSVSGRIDLLEEHLDFYAQTFNTIEHAKEYIEEFKEQRFKTFVKTVHEE